MSLVPAVTALLWAGGAGGAPAIIALPVVADFPSLHEFRHFMRDQGLAVPLRRVLSALSEHSRHRNPLSVIGVTADIDRRGRIVTRECPRLGHTETCSATVDRSDREPGGGDGFVGPRTQGGAGLACLTRDRGLLHRTT